jgi:hypothetical protein
MNGSLRSVLVAAGVAFLLGCTAERSESAEARRWHELGPDEMPPSPTFAPPPPPLPASRHPAHFGNKPAALPATNEAAIPPPPVTADTMAKQQEYVARWDKMRAQLRALPQAEQDERLAALKRSVLGE